MDKRYQGLRVLAIGFQILAWGVLVVGMTAGLAVLVGMSHAAPKAMGLAILGVSTLYFCLLSAFSGVLSLLLTIEQRTRSSQ